MVQPHSVSFTVQSYFFVCKHTFVIYPRYETYGSVPIYHYVNSVSASLISFTALVAAESQHTAQSPRVAHGQQPPASEDPFLTYPRAE